MNIDPALLPFAFAIPWLLFAPGYFTQIWFVSRWPLKVQSGAEGSGRRSWLETGFIALLFSLCLVGWGALVLVELGWFSLARLLILVLAYCLALGALISAQAGKRGWRVQRCLWSRFDRWHWVLVIVVLISAVLYFHPHEYILGGSDAGVYVNLGAHIVRSGALGFDDPELASLRPEWYPALFREQPPDLITRYIQFPGFYLSDVRAGRVITQFYPLHSTWLAVFNSLGGVRASLYATPLWGVLAVLAVGLTAATLFGRRTGALAAALLAVSATQIWFARYPTTEALTQLLLFGGIYAFSRYMADGKPSVNKKPSAEKESSVNDSPEMGILAGLALGQVMLVRLDTYFLLAIPLCLVAYLHVTRRLTRRALAFLIPFLLLGLHSLAHGVLQSWPYLYNSYRFQLRGLMIPGLAVVAGMALIGFLILDFWARGRAERLSQLAHWVGRGATVLGVLVVLAAVYAFFVRPAQADPARTVFTYWYAENEIPDVEPYNLVRLGWYLSPLGIGLGVLGWWWMLRRDVAPRTALFMGVGLFFSFLYLQNSRNNPHHIYVMRRYVPAVIPAFTIGAAYAIDRLWRRKDRGRWLAWGLALVQVAALLYAARIVVRQVDHRGLVRQLSAWAEALDPDDVILFDDDRPVSSGATVGTALRYLYGHTVFDLQELFLTKETLTRLVEHWQAQGRRVLVAVGPDGLREPFVGLTLSPLSQLWLDTRVLESSYFHFPRKVNPTTLTVELYEVLPAAFERGDTLRVDVGSSDFFFLGRGWHGKERLASNITMRWTSSTAKVALPACPLQAGDMQLELQMAASPQAPQTPAAVRLWYGETLIARWQVTTTFDTYEATVAASAGRENPEPLRLEVDAWSPLATGLSADARELGVMVDWIDVRCGK